MIRIVNGTDSEIHTFYELLRIYFPYYETSGELFLSIDTTEDEKHVVLVIGDERFEKTFPYRDEFETKRKIASWIARDVEHEDKEDCLWGIMTGTRPIKFLQTYRKELGDEKAFRYLVDEYLLDPETAKLLMNIAVLETKKTSDIEGKGYSLYIHVPFCATRCDYCSYPTICSDNHDAVDEYMKYLLKELDFVLKKMGTPPTTIYIGGGTPTSIALEKLSLILDRFKGMSPREFTLEAGRPETIDKALIERLSDYPVTRISINPQTMVDRTLAQVKRPHRAEDIERAYREVRAYSDLEVNMDVILGLGDEGLSEVRYTFDRLIDMEPENITVHVLSLKNGSKIFENEGVYTKNIRNMQIYTMKRMREADYHPYYLYRQKRIMGNGSNIGFARGDTESLYNMIMMEEIHSVIGVGMSSTSKLVDRHGKTIRKFSNFRNLRDYTDRFGEVLAKKSKFLREVL
ncbi:MAG: coproporphyrinogen dehydrogenase HemZ [Peptoniphilus sp.]|nr:coproporphyrinogen dehydrogenase HemZ [Peptoniphilus sp.]MDD7363344.1 coproporphyrinogen dehydrogenase HemZ [Bacillota bacterium]MDY6044263.1 coproporphyrinogen dehydrogenase HemZ [Peptoniphilus sp.]